MHMEALCPKPGMPRWAMSAPSARTPELWCPSSWWCPVELQEENPNPVRSWAGFAKQQAEAIQAYIQALLIAGCPLGCRYQKKPPHGKKEYWQPMLPPSLLATGMTAIRPTCHWGGPPCISIIWGSCKAVKWHMGFQPCMYVHQLNDDNDANEIWCRWLGIMGL